MTERSDAPLDEAFFVELIASKKAGWLPETGNVYLFSFTEIQRNALVSLLQAALSQPAASRYAVLEVMQQVRDKIARIQITNLGQGEVKDEAFALIDAALDALKNADPQVDKVVAASTAAGELAPAESAPSAQRRVVVPRESHRLVYNKATKRIERVSNVTGLVADSFEPPSECSIAHEHRYERDGERPGE